MELQQVVFEVTSYVAEKDIGDGDGFSILVEVTNLVNVPLSVVKPYLAHCQFVMQRHRRLGDLSNLVSAITYSRKAVEEAFDKSYCCLKKAEAGTVGLYQKVKIRLRGVDAPEILQPYGTQARTHLKTLIQEKNVRVVAYYVDDFDRYVSDVYIGSQLLQPELLKKGSVWHYEFFDNRAEFARLHKEAKDDGLGLWGFSKNPEPPWVYKSKNWPQGPVAQKENQLMELKFRGGGQGYVYTG